MVDQAEISLGEGAPLRLRIHSKLRKRELSCLSPQFDGCLDLRSPQQIGLLGRLGRLWHHGSGAVHVVTTNLVFGAITAASVSTVCRL